MKIDRQFYSNRTLPTQRVREDAMLCVSRSVPVASGPAVVKDPEELVVMRFSIGNGDKSLRVNLTDAEAKRLAVQLYHLSDGENVPD